MRQRGARMALLVATALLVGAGGFRVKLVDRWTDPGFERRPFRKLLVIAITDDPQIRRRFENRFVSHLRGKMIEGVTSYSMVPDLSRAEDEDAIVERIQARGIDAAVSVRLVALDDLGEEAWGNDWRAANETAGDLRALIHESLPVTVSSAKQFGIEVALWETSSWHRIWAGRSGSYSRKQLKKGAGDFVQSVLHLLSSEDLL